MDNLPPVSSPRDHTIQFYTDKNVLLDGWASFIINTIETGDAAICVATQTHSEGLAERLKLHDRKVTVASEQGRYVTWDAAEVVSTVAPQGKFSEARFFNWAKPSIAKIRAGIERENSRVVVMGEGVALLWSKGAHEDVIRWEHSWDGLALANSLSLRCFYPIQSLDFRREQDNCQMLCAEHSTATLPIGLPTSSRENGKARTEIELEEVMAQAAELIQGELRLRSPEWQGKYRAALLETDRAALFKKVEVAQAAVLTRLEQLRPETANLSEWYELVHARSGLQIIKEEKLGFFE